MDSTEEYNNSDDSSNESSNESMDDYEPEPDYMYHVWINLIESFCDYEDAQKITFIQEKHKNRDEPYTFIHARFIIEVDRKQEFVQDFREALPISVFNNVFGDCAPVSIMLTYDDLITIRMNERYYPLYVFKFARKLFEVEIHQDDQGDDVITVANRILPEFTSTAPKQAP